MNGIWKCLFFGHKFSVRVNAKLHIAKCERCPATGWSRLSQALFIGAVLMVSSVAMAQTGSPVNIRDKSTGNAATVTGGALAVSFSNADATGTPTALNGSSVSATVATAGFQGCGMFLAAGTLAATLTPEVSYDAGTTWVASQFYNPTTQALAATLVFTNPNAATEDTVLMAGGVSNCRVRTSAFTSGAATATMRATTNPAGVTTIQGAISGTVTANQGGAPWTFNPVGFSSGLVTGQTTATNSATALATNTVHSACVTADANNLVVMYAGPTGETSGNGYPLYAGMEQCWTVTNTNQLFILAPSGSPVADWTGL